MTPQHALSLASLIELARAMGVPLPPDRAKALVDEVNGLFAFTDELDALVTPDVMPATAFRASDE